MSRLKFYARGNGMEPATFVVSIRPWDPLQYPGFNATSASKPLFVSNPIPVDAPGMVAREIAIDGVTCEPDTRYALYFENIGPGGAALALADQRFETESYRIKNGKLMRMAQTICLRLDRAKNGRDILYSVGSAFVLISLIPMGFEVRALKRAWNRLRRGEAL